MPTQPNKNLRLARDVMEWVEFTEADFEDHVIFIDNKGVQRFVRKRGDQFPGILGTEFNPTNEMSSALEVLEKLIGTPRVAITLASQPNNIR